MEERTEKKKILHVAKYYFPFRGGTEQITQDCINALRENHEQKVICFNHEQGDSRDIIDGIEINRCGCFAKIASQSLSVTYERTLRRVIEGFDPDIILFHYPNPFVAGMLLKHCRRKTALVVYWHLDIVKQKLLRRFFITQNIRLVRRADLLIATSPNYIEGSPWLSSAREKCLVIPNCINTDRMAVTKRASKIADRLKERFKDRILCFAIGRHTKYKGFDYLLQASRLLDDRFVIVIGGTGEETEKLKKAARGDGKVHFIGSVDDDTLKGFMLAMDIYCFPSVTKNEAFGISLAEAMYYEKPAVTFTIPGSGVNYVCRKDEEGLQVPNRDVRAYAYALIRLAEDSKLRARLGKSGRKRVEDLFLLNRYQENIRDAFRSLEAEKCG